MRQTKDKGIEGSETKRKRKMAKLQKLNTEASGISHFLTLFVLNFSIGKYMSKLFLYTALQ